MNPITSIPINFSQVHQEVKNFVKHFNPKEDFENQLKRSFLHELLPPNRVTVCRKSGSPDFRKDSKHPDSYLHIKLNSGINVKEAQNYFTGEEYEKLEGRYKTAHNTSDESIKILKLQKNAASSKELASLIWEAWMMHKYKDISEIMPGKFGLYPGFTNKIKGLTIPQLWGNLGCLALLREHLQEHEKLNIALQISRAIKAIHNRGDVHLDLKPEQIILNRNNNGSVSAYLTDLASVTAEESFFYTYKNWKVRKDIPNSLEYLSPEIKSIAIDFHNNPNTTVTIPEIHPKPIDIWSLGTIFYFIVNDGPLPFCNRYATTPSQLYLDGLYQALQNEKNSNQTSINNTLLKTAYFCCKADPKIRPTIDKIVEVLEAAQAQCLSTTDQSEAV